jgi:hypothetical protein
MKSTTKTNPEEPRFRVEFQFRNPAGGLLGTKTWEISNGPKDPPRNYCLQGAPVLADYRPQLRKIGPGNYLVEVTVTADEGLWTVAVLDRYDYGALFRQLTASPVTFILVMSRHERRLHLHTNLGTF